MRTKIVVFSWIAFTLSVLITSAVFADCQGGKKEITIINPAGKVITICVPEAAIPNVGGDGDVVIPAVCPCFTQEDVEAAVNNYPDIVCYSIEGFTRLTEESCTYAECYYNDQEFLAVEGPHRPVKGEGGDDPGGCTFISPGGLIFGVDPNNGCENPDDVMFITEDEADACVAILETFVQ